MFPFRTEFVAFVLFDKGIAVISFKAPVDGAVTHDLHLSSVAHSHDCGALGKFTF